MSTIDAYHLHKGDLVIFPDGWRAIVSGVVRKDDHVEVWFGAGTAWRKPVIYGLEETVNVSRRGAAS